MNTMTDTQTTQTVPDETTIDRHPSSTSKY